MPTLAISFHFSIKWIKRRSLINIVKIDEQVDTMNKYLKFIVVEENKVISLQNIFIDAVIE